MGMGSAFTGLADDASAPYYNPAGLAFLDEHQLLVMHAPLFLETHFNYLSSAHPFGDKWGAVALSDALLLSNGIKVRDGFNRVTNSNGDVRDNVISASYARKIFRNFAAGVNINYIEQKVIGFSDSTLGYDLGFLYRPSRWLSAGASFVNINTPKIKLDRVADEFRPLSRFGLASEVFEDRLTLTADLTRINKQSSLAAMGAELTVNHLIQLRAGFNGNRSLTMGAGLRFNSFRVDYSFSNTDVGAFNKVSFTWAWHNIYQTEIEPPLSQGRPVFPLSGFENEVTFKTMVPNHVVAKWSLLIKNAMGDEVRTLQGDLRPPENIVWNARTEIGEPVIDGTYNYTFMINYKNGKEWKTEGIIALDLPNHKIEEVIDMNLQLNGALIEPEIETTETAAVPETDPSITDEEIENAMDLGTTQEEPKQ